MGRLQAMGLLQMHGLCDEYTAATWPWAMDATRFSGFAAVLRIQGKDAPALCVHSSGDNLRTNVNAKLIAPRDPRMWGGLARVSD
jgi:hypothetical protein